MEWIRASTRGVAGVAVLACGLAALTAVLARAESNAAPSAPATLVTLRGHSDPEAVRLLRGAGASLVAPELRLWRLPAATANEVVTALRHAGVLERTQGDLEYRTTAAADFTDPLVAGEWWRSVVGVQGLTPPGPGAPVTIVDSGVSFVHPEFAERLDLVALNPQEHALLGEGHGTAVASVVGAPANGVGLVGIYPQSVIHSYDAAIGGGMRLSTSAIVAGILAASRAGRSVINLSLGTGTRDVAIESAVGEAVRRGSLVVAAAGNSGETGDERTFPADLPHVLTAAASDLTDRAALFSSRSPFVDLAAPGVEIPVASATGGGYRTSSGTSFAAPIVSGAAAWLWTLRPELDAGQVAQVLRRSARDVPPLGFDQATGYGILDVPAALAYPAPTSDPGEPNDDVAWVSGRPAPLTTRTRISATTTGSVMPYEDPRDVMRVWLPAGKTLRVSATSSVPDGLVIALFREDAESVVGRIASAERIVRASRSGVRSSLSFRNVKRGRWLFLLVAPARGVREVGYTLRATTL